MNIHRIIICRKRIAVRSLSLLRPSVRPSVRACVTLRHALKSQLLFIGWRDDDDDDETRVDRVEN